VIFETQFKRKQCFLLFYSLNTLDAESFVYSLTMRGNF